VFALIAACGGSDALAPEIIVHVEGTILWQPTGQPLGAATVLLQHFKTNGNVTVATVVASDDTDSQGKFVLILALASCKGLEDGFVIFVNAPDHMPYGVPDHPIIECANGVQLRNLDLVPG
jgi:hypothetical protein